MSATLSTARQGFARAMVLGRQGWTLAKPVLRAHKRECMVLGAIALVLLGPFILRPSDSTTPSRYDRRLVIMTPHHEVIRREFGRAFAREWKQKTGETLYIDWRVAGTSELRMMVKSDFASAFQYHWKRRLGKTWDDEVGKAFMSPKAPAGNEARAEFMKSNVGIGVDVFFGGGPYDFQALADAGAIVATDPATGAGLPRIKEKHAAWFGDKALPAKVSGEAFYEKEMRWCGTALSSFGIVFNRDVLRRLGIEKEPEHWSDLTDPKFFGQIALADPSKSSSVTKAFEMLIQEQMHVAIDRLTKTPGKLRSPEEIEAAGVREGWMKGLALLQRISANTRYFTDTSTKIPLDVGKGDCAAGMCIDFYGRSTEEDVRKADGTSRVGFIAPVGGTAISVDPIAMMRGAKEPELAQGFMEFVLSDAGQKLWNYRAKVPGGPESVALRRLPVRKDLYTEANRALMMDANEHPFEKAKAFVYHPEWTSGTFNVIAFLMRVMCVDSHHELRDAWKAVADGGMNPRALEALHQLQLVNYDAANGELARILASRDKVQEVREARRLTETFRRNYSDATRFAKNAR
jgi:ABC-type Fe3+ transport system substrate-binding protein